MLYVVATPIGNLSDITLRALEVLKQVDFIIAENPGHSGILLGHHGLPKKELVQFAEHNELKVLDKLVARLKISSGALISDAGTPGISDPGFRLVRACVNAGVAVVPIAGPNAAVTALSASGLPTDKFTFVGFLPKTEPKLLRLLEETRSTEATLISYESPQRIQKTVLLITKSYPDCFMVIARELSKLHEEFIRGTATEILQQIHSRDTLKGELVVLLSFKR